MIYLELGRDWDENMTVNFASFNLQEFVKFQNSSFTTQVTLDIVRSNRSKEVDGQHLASFPEDRLAINSVKTL